MPFNDAKFAASPTNGDIGEALLTLSLGMIEIKTALRRIATEAGVEIEPQLSGLQTAIDQLDKQFATLTGWSAK